jgi:hypothetical protein
MPNAQSPGCLFYLFEGNQAAHFLQCPLIARLMLTCALRDQPRSPDHYQSGGDWKRPICGLPDWGKWELKGGGVDLALNPDG